MRRTKHHKYIISIGLGILFVVSLFIWSRQTSSSQYQRLFFIIPHFVIAPEKLDPIWQQAAKDIQTDEPTIIIISPDHFDTYRTNKVEYDQSITNVCVQGYCQQSQGAWLPNNKKSSMVHSNTLLLPDHGIGAHLRFIKKWIPKAKVVPLLLQGRSIDDIEAIKKTINTISKKQPTIVIGSIDRSHYVPEPWAKLHDTTARSLLNTNNSDRRDRQKLDIDCPSCLWLVNGLAQQEDKKPTLLWRDSSAELFGTIGVDNTSRSLIAYTRDDKKIVAANQQPELDIGVTLLAGGDIIYDRGVSQILPNIESLAEHFRERYELYDVRTSPFTTFHKLGAGIDITMVNLETPLHKTNESCYPIKKPYSFCSDESILGALSAIGFNTISFANNHRFDAGRQQYETTKKIITDHNMNLVSDDHTLKQDIRGILIALHAYDLTNPNKDTTLIQACKDITTSTQEGYKAIVSLHRGEEYQTQQNKEQTHIAQKLIACGAKAIIGHHPHVVQSIERIDSVPVIYSLGNFLMDQGFSKETERGMIAGMIIPQTGMIRVFTGDIDARP